jgi:predicted permease
MTTFTREIGLVSRRLLRHPAFTFIAVATLALGIGANTAIFSLVNGILLKPLPFDKPEELVAIWFEAPGLGFGDVPQSPALHFTMVEEGTSFSEMGMWANGSVSVTGNQEPEQVQAMLVTDGTLRALRIQPSLGRRFSPEDDASGSAETVILSHGYWQTRFGGDPQVLGRSLTVDGRPREIIGVMSPGFRFLDQAPVLYFPFRFDRSQVFLGNFSYRALGRLEAGVSLDQAQADAARLIPLAVEKFPGGIGLDMLENARFAPNLRPLKADVVGDVGNILWVLLGTVGMILLMACANVANLFLVRAEGREREMAVRSAMGARRGAVAREFLKESLLLGVLGGIGGIAVAWGGLRLLSALGPQELPRLAEVSMDGGVLLFTLALSLFSGAFFGLFPALKYRRAGLVGALKEGGRGGSSGRERHRARNTLVVVQVALALLLLVGSGLMVRSFQALRNVDPGFRNPQEVLLVRLSIPSAEVQDPEEVARMHQLLHQRLARIPGVTTVGLTSSVTMDGFDSNDPIFVEDFPVPEGQIPPIRRFKWVGEDYFAAMQIPLVAGRAIDWRDSFDLNQVAMITESLAREYWSSPAEALGKRISTGLAVGNWAEIVGVTGNVRDDGLDQDPTAVVYWPLLQRNPWGDLPVETPAITGRRSMNYVIRSPRVGSQELMAEIREAVWEVNPNLPLAGVRTLDELLASTMARTSFTLVMLGIAAAVALLLGAIGIYGVVSYVVSQRTREMGVRLALGASASAVQGMVLRQGFVLAGMGVVLGLAAAFGLTRLMESLLYGVEPADPLTFVSVALALALVALLASWLPARRAARTDPLEAIRWE